MRLRKFLAQNYQLRLLATALVFYTRIPLPLWFDYSPTYLDHASRYLPTIGLLVGSVGGVVFSSSDLLFSTQISILLSMAATIALTGAFHEDGFADMCDGFGGGWTRERVLEIMKDSRVGSFGATGLIILLLLKFFALTEINPTWIPVALVAGHSVSRLIAISYLATHSYVQAESQSKVKPLAETITLSGAIIACTTALIPVLLGWWVTSGFAPSLMPEAAVGAAAGMMFWVALIPVVVVRWIMGRMFIRKLGGYTGDCLGAAQQVTEVVYYLGIGALGVLG